MVVPWGARSPALPWGTARREGRSSGAWSERKSANDETPGCRKAAGRRGSPARLEAFMVSRGPRAGGRRTCSLAALLDEGLHEVFRVGLEDVVDLVEDGVDVVVQRFLALGDIALGDDFGGLLHLRGLARLLLLLGHDTTLATDGNVRG